MTDEECLRKSFVALEVNGEFSEAVLQMGDGSRLHFCHRVGERWVKAEGDDAGMAGAVLARIARFRLNARHLDVQFEDGSRWEAGFGGLGKA
jgi:hypothetical protein